MTAEATTTEETTTAAGPVRLQMEGTSGSLPPPYNFEWSLDISTEPGSTATYRLAYLYRDQLQPGEPQPEDDIDWSGELDAGIAAQLATIISYLPPPEGPLPEDEQSVGGPAMHVRLTAADGTVQEGEPQDQSLWVGLPCLFDQLARTEAGRVGSANFCPEVG